MFDIFSTQVGDTLNPIGGAMSQAPGWTSPVPNVFGDVAGDHFFWIATTPDVVSDPAAVKVVST